MKKLIYGALFLTLVGIVFVGCKKKTVNPIDQQVLKIINQNSEKTGINAFDYSNLSTDQKIVEFDKIGIMHNQGLDYTYEYILSKKTSNITIQQVKEYAKEGLNFYTKNLGGTLNDSNTQAFINEVAQSSNLQNLLDFKIGQLNLSNNQKKYLDSIHIEYNSLFQTKNLALFDQRLIQLEYSAIKVLSDNEELTILSYLAVSRASITYWSTYGDNWIENVPYAKKPSYWGGVGKADGAGAAAGAGAWGAGALFGGPATWGAFGASVASWSVGCSIYAMF